jgi:hypothetical protein
MRQLDYENDDYDLTSQQTVLTHTPDVSNATLCSVLLLIGDGTKDLDSDGGGLELQITVDGCTWQGDVQDIAYTVDQVMLSTDSFNVPTNKEVVVKLESTNSDDSDVDVRAYLYEAWPLSLTLSTTQMIRGTVDDSDFTPTVTRFEADDITEATSDHYNGRIILFTSGNLAGQATEITDYSLEGSNGRFMVKTMTEAPSDNDTFLII